eukprot:3689851-Rhodomonas_salina.1
MPPDDIADALLRYDVFMSILYLSRSLALDPNESRNFTLTTVPLSLGVRPRAARRTEGGG